MSSLVLRLSLVKPGSTGGAGGGGGGASGSDSEGGAGASSDIGTRTLSTVSD